MGKNRCAHYTTVSAGGVVSPDDGAGPGAPASRARSPIGPSLSVLVISTSSLPSGLTMVNPYLPSPVSACKAMCLLSGDQEGQPSPRPLFVTWTMAGSPKEYG